MAEQTPAQVAPPEDRLSPKDPALVALNKMAKLLGPYDRKAQLKILANVCVQLEYFDYAEIFMHAASREP